MCLCAAVYGVIKNNNLVRLSSIDPCHIIYQVNLYWRNNSAHKYNYFETLFHTLAFHTNFSRSFHPCNLVPHFHVSHFQTPDRAMQHSDVARIQWPFLRMRGDSGEKRRQRKAGNGGEQHAMPRGWQIISATSVPLRPTHRKRCRSVIANYKKLSCRRGSARDDLCQSIFCHVRVAEMFEESHALEGLQ